MRKNPKRRGEMGEISFLQRASQKGLRVSRPFGDSDAYDFIVDNGRQRWRVQEKVTSTRHSKGSYSIKAGRRAYVKAGEEAVFLPYLASEIDFLALHFAPEDMWFIIPIEALNGRTSLCFAFRYPDRGLVRRFWKGGICCWGRRPKGKGVWATAFLHPGSRQNPTV